MPKHLAVEFEATFPNVEKDEVRGRLRDAGATLVRPEFLQRRAVFRFPSGHEIAGGWLRVRDEGDKITMSLKVVSGDKIEDQKEICVVVDDFDKAAEFLEISGCTKKAYQETRRELWQLDGVDITIDEWPFLPPFVEVEGADEMSVKKVSEKIGFDYAQAMFCHVGVLYGLHYHCDEDVLNNQTPLLVFSGENPFVQLIGQ